MTTPNLDLNAGGPYGPYAIFCSVPPNGSVWDYPVSELKAID